MSTVGIALTDLVAALDTVVHRVIGDAASVPAVRTAVVADAADLAHGAPLGDLVLLVGVDAAAAVAAITASRSRPDDETHPAEETYVLKSDAVDGSVERAARRNGIVVVEVDERARWDQVFGIIARRLAGAAGAGAETGPFATDTDLFGLVNLVAEGTGGLVSIEDATSSRVLAYSPSDGFADDLRVATILGRGGPPEQLRLLRERGVVDALRRSGEPVAIPAQPGLGWRRRLAVGVHDPVGRQLGTIWVQQGGRPLSDDAAEVLRGASAIAARILLRAREAPSTEGQLVARLFGFGGGIDASSAGAYLRLPPAGGLAVAGIAPTGGDPEGHAAAIAAVGGALRLHASAFAARSVVAVRGTRGYLLIPADDLSPRAAHGVAGWLGEVLTRLDSHPLIAPNPLHAALVTPVDGLAAVAAARAEVDRVLDATGSGSSRVTTLEESRTAVLLSEILQVVGERDELRDPRIARLIEYDAAHDGSLVGSVGAFLDAHGNVRDAARRLGVHPNSLRYRVERAQQLTGLDLADPGDRLLAAVQLAVLRRPPGGVEP